MTPPITKALAIDCEMVEGRNKNSLLAQVTIINENGDLLMNYYVEQSDVKDYRTNVTGITPINLEMGLNYEVVKREVARLIQGTILVGHALHHDLEALGLTHPEEMQWDSAQKFRNEKGPQSLKDLAKEHLNLIIQDGPHNALEDARAVMRLYKKFKN